MLSDPLFEVSIPNRERHSIGYLAKECSSLADSDSDERVSLFFNLLQIWLRKLNLRRRLIHKKKGIFPTQPYLQAKGTNVKGKEQGLSLKKLKKKSFRKKRS